ncbi:MAG: aminomethyl-transferring glycine dehydrogenase [Actinomycetota bacterium]|nr:aminomethyl-transferring glycine dehydrogenase [Actinomycetota bacterium]
MLSRLDSLSPSADFSHRHVGTSPADQARMLERLGYPSASALLAAAVPPALRSARDFTLPPARAEHEVLEELREIAAANQRFVSLIGMGFSGTVTPPVIQRNVLENPGWYTAYTPYQAEISQGRLEALLNFQTMVADLTALEIANASMLDESSAAAEAMSMCHAAARRTDGAAFVVDRDSHPQTIEVVTTRARARGIPVVVADPLDVIDQGDVFGVLVQYPSTTGEVRDLRELCERAHGAGALVVVAADLLALSMLEAPGEAGADIAVGNTQRFGVPLWYGGPHAAYLATKAAHQRLLPGRIVGASVDAEGRAALRLALQTREQHIRRERATSNICTAQALLAMVAGFYAAYHGPEGLRAIAERAHRLTTLLAAGLSDAGLAVETKHFFDTIVVHVPGHSEAVHEAARTAGFNLRRLEGERVGISLDEKSTPELVGALWRCFGVPVSSGGGAALLEELDGEVTSPLEGTRLRTSPYLTHPVFHRYRSETAMARYLRSLADKDLALDRTMIPLGSCTMKLNAAVEMAAISWPEFADVHPFAPIDQTAGYQRIIADLESWLGELSGYDAVSLQPNAGSQGELAGLLAIRGYLDSIGEQERSICLVPTSAHGTNAASAAMAGMRVVTVACDAQGNVDLADLEAKIAANPGAVAAIMLTYPSTHGVYEERVGEICARVHAAGGQVYIDGANLNALVGLSRFAEIGGDVSHFNLHKTFCIPHGGGGPGVGPIGVRSHLADFLPGSTTLGAPLAARRGGAVAGAPFGSPGVLPISWAYVRLMGAAGILAATEAAVLSANYVAHRLKEAYPVLYRGRNALIAHECVLDLREITHRCGVTNEDVAKRLIDYGFHAPTMSFPVAGTLMVEPTESEPIEELDRFCEAMLSIRAEIAEVETGSVPLDESVLRNAPHTAQRICADDWDRPYRREDAAFPRSGAHPAKYWPPVARIDNAYGDRNLFCTCLPVEEVAMQAPR